jgi:hypothetical protein
MTHTAMIRILAGHFDRLLDRRLRCHGPGRSNVAGPFAAFYFTTEGGTR